MKCTAICTALLAAVLAACAWGAESPPGDPAARTAPLPDPLDRELLRDLESRSGDAPPEPAEQPQPREARQPGEAGQPEEEPIGPGEQGPGQRGPGAQPSGPPAQQEGLEQRLKHELGRAAVSEQQEPLLEIARQMRVVEKRIEQYDSGSTTQGMQQQIVADLERLIAQARKACKQGGPAAGQPQQVAGRTPVGQPDPQSSGGQQPAERPGTTSAPRQGEAEPGAAGADAGQLRELVKDLWGELPPRAREQMLETFDEAFVPKYRLLIEQYFRRLAEARGPDGLGP